MASRIPASVSADQTPRALAARALMEKFWNAIYRGSKFDQDSALEALNRLQMEAEQERQIALRDAHERELELLRESARLAQERELELQRRQEEAALERTKAMTPVDAQIFTSLVKHFGLLEGFRAFEEYKNRAAQAALRSQTDVTRSLLGALGGLGQAGIRAEAQRDVAQTRSSADLEARQRAAEAHIISTFLRSPAIGMMDMTPEAVAKNLPAVREFIRSLGVEGILSTLPQVTGLPGGAPAAAPGAPSAAPGAPAGPLPPPVLPSLRPQAPAAPQAPGVDVGSLIRLITELAQRTAPQPQAPAKPAYRERIVGKGTPEDPYRQIYEPVDPAEGPPTAPQVPIQDQIADTIQNIMLQIQRRRLLGQPAP